MSERDSRQAPVIQKRKRKVLLPDLQMKIVFVTLCVAVIVLAVNFQLDLLSLSRTRSHPPATTEGVFDAVRQGLTRQFFLALVIAVPIALWVGLVYSFKFCGPIYGLMRQLRDRVHGRWGVPFRLRRGDALQELKDALNSAQAAMGEFMARQDALLLRAARCIREGDVAGEEAAAKLLAEIDEQSRQFAARSGKGEAAASPVPEGSVQA